MVAVRRPRPGLSRPAFAGRCSEFMELLVGRPVSPGFAQGTAVLFDINEKVEVPRYQIAQTDVDRELERFRQALTRSSCDLEELESRVSAELGYAHSSIFS